MVRLVGFLFPLIHFPGMPVTVMPGRTQITVPKREPFYGDEIDYVQPSLSTFEFLCFPLTMDSPGVYEASDTDFCIPYFPEEDISAKTIITQRT